jgi:hypothetical protein
MARLGKIATIKRVSKLSTANYARWSRYGKGLTRVPGTGVFKYPYKELDGKYRTGLDPDAAYIRRISDPLERDWKWSV